MRPRFAVLLGLILAPALCMFAAPAARAQTATPATPATATPRATHTATPPPATPPPAAVQPITPPQLTLSGVRGDTETRQLFLRLPAGTTEVGFYPLDLPNGDETEVFPASALRVEASGPAVITKPLTMTFTAFLSDTPSGRYAGNALFTFGPSEQWLPITVSVKDWWFLPLIVLVGGVMLGYGLTYYRERLLPRDELVVGVDDLRARISADADLLSPAASPFYARADASLHDALAAARAGTWQAGRDALATAQRVHDLWSRERVRWLEVLGQQSELLAWAEKPEPQGAGLRRGSGEHPEELLDALDGGALEAIIAAALARTAATAGTSDAQTLHKRLDELEEQVKAYAARSAQIAQARGLLTNLPADQKTAFAAKLDRHAADLNALKPVSDAAGYAAGMQAVADAVEATRAAVKQALADAKVPAPAALAQGGGMGATAAPARAPLSKEYAGIISPKWARRMLRAFSVATWAVALLLLAGAGFQELYINNPTFGASRWGDYFGLFAWGFGAEATRAGVSALIRGWDLPFPGTRTQP